MARSNSFGAKHNELPHNFGKASSHPSHTKKGGAGRGNWGKEGDELLDVEGDFTFAHTHRRSNSTSLTAPVFPRNFLTNFKYNANNNNHSSAVFDDSDLK